MKIVLDKRTIKTVEIYYEQSKQPIIKSMLPQTVCTLEEAVSYYQETLLPTATSYGRTIKVDSEYVGDIWCYRIRKDENPNAMLSYCVFNKSFWNKGIASEAVCLFLEEVAKRYKLGTIGAFTFSDNIASIKVLEKVGFSFVEDFTEDGKKSKYYQYLF